MKENLNEYELIVSEGRRPIWMRILAALFFTLMICTIYEVAMEIYNSGTDELNTNEISREIKTIALCLAGGISFSVTKTVLLNLDNDLLISRFCVGPFSRDVKSKVPQLEYVSVFWDAEKEYYQVNLWYVGNKHYKMYFFDEKKSAMKFAELTAIKLNIDFLDATEKGNSKWIDIPTT